MASAADSETSAEGFANQEVALKEPGEIKKEDVVLSHLEAMSSVGSMLGSLIQVIELTHSTTHIWLYYY